MKTSDLERWLTNINPGFIFKAALPPSWDALVLTCTEKVTGYYFSVPISGVTLENFSEEELQTYVVHLGNSMILALAMRKTL